MGKLSHFTTNIDSLIPVDWKSWTFGLNTFPACMQLLPAIHMIPKIIFGPLPKEPRGCSLKDFSFKL